MGYSSIPHPNKRKSSSRHVGKLWGRSAGRRLFLFSNLFLYSTHSDHLQKLGTKKGPTPIWGDIKHDGWMSI
jgi:hypothetical protein